MKIGAIAEQLGVSLRTLRFYEEQGLVHPRRTLGGTRIYDEDDKARFEALLTLARLGFSLERLAELTAIRPSSHSGDEASHKAASLLKLMDADLQELMNTINQQRKDIKKAQIFLKNCYGCQRKPIRQVCDSCEISSQRQGIEVLKVIWDEPSRT